MITDEHIRLKPNEMTSGNISALKSKIEKMTAELNDYYTSKTCDEKFALKTSIPSTSNFITTTDADEKYSTKSEIKANYYDKTTCDNKYYLKDSANEELADKTYVAQTYYNKYYIDQNYYTKTKTEERFATKQNIQNFIKLNHIKLTMSVNETIGGTENDEWFIMPNESVQWTVPLQNYYSIILFPSESEGNVLSGAQAVNITANFTLGFDKLSGEQHPPEGYKRREELANTLFMFGPDPNDDHDSQLVVPTFWSYFDTTGEVSGKNGIIAKISFSCQAFTHEGKWYLKMFKLQHIPGNFMVSKRSSITLDVFKI